MFDNRSSYNAWVIVTDYTFSVFENTAKITQVNRKIKM